MNHIGIQIGWPTHSEPSGQRLPEQGQNQIGTSMPDRGAIWQSQIWQIAFFNLAAQKAIWQTGEAIWPDYCRLASLRHFATVLGCGTGVFDMISQQMTARRNHTELLEGGLLSQVQVVVFCFSWESVSSDWPGLRYSGNRAIPSIRVIGQ